VLLACRFQLLQPPYAFVHLYTVLAGAVKTAQQQQPAAEPSTQQPPQQQSEPATGSAGAAPNDAGARVAALETELRRAKRAEMKLQALLFRWVLTRLVMRQNSAVRHQAS
jgi:hypothetical protein